MTIETHLSTHLTTQLTTAIPSPVVAAWHLGPLTLRAYALCILAGIVVAVWITGRRLVDRGGTAEQALDVAAWAVPFGIVGGRLYHVITTPQPYFGEGGQPVRALFIWQGGLGIWGAVALGALGAWIGCRRNGVRFLDFADSAAPGVAVAQALGRWGNWFNNELYGRHTDVPWALTIHEWDQSKGQAVRDAAGNPIVLGTFHPTFLYESLWCLVLALLLVLADRRFSLRRGQVFALYIAGYPVGRIVFELMRSDTANKIFNVRVNVWTSILVFLLGVGLFALFAKRARVAEATLETSHHPG
ncbi:Prolipoprotein diacylglyceryl transferase [Pedococcus cremeus]|uniref:Phosphatidylglycerol--prolipoprotein diacylglyceryl transferase n=1 Tax=Pedococcus cremeus TaxID=587636 RepID=A0A1H9X2H6_9MICO|nr:prolipoprotein diacylglyceryl transferase [Pedococcus cremeus]SES40087.1 Prolipoprotein diacylglyceryl transferase [Pedococcus cremeus]